MAEGLGGSMLVGLSFLMQGGGVGRREAAAQKGTREDSYMRWEGRGSLLTVVLVWALAG